MAQRELPPYRADHVGSLLRPPELLQARVEVELEPRAFAHWAGADGWVVEPGTFELRVGPSAVEHPLRASIDAPGCSL